MNSHRLDITFGPLIAGWLSMLIYLDALPEYFFSIGLS
jgi:hypothetical protein